MYFCSSSSDRGLSKYVVDGDGGEEEDELDEELITSPGTRSVWSFSF
jgi:hypothetical protein